ncbi:MAG: four helix bundle protein [Clostridia bacterium]|nr:four helix bundle protein [Clostridia bacterium]
MKNYRDLLVWQKAMDLVEEIYKITLLLPNEELYGLSIQLKRAAVSIPSNIAEGYERNSTNDYLKFLSIAKASREVVETKLYICVRLKFIEKEDIDKAINICDEIKRMIIAMMKNMNNGNM